MHAMRDSGKHAHDMGSATPNGYGGDSNVYDGYQTPSNKQESPVLSDTLAVVGGMLLPLLTQVFGHGH
jgi:zinc transporter 9